MGRGMSKPTSNTPTGERDILGADEGHSVIPGNNPFALFEDWFAEAQASEPNDPNAMALATATSGAAPSVRMVLLKGHGLDGFTFYTNANSRKGAEIRANIQAALLFHWKSLRRQIRIEGALEEVSAAMADDYFHSRPRKSQIASAASDQSEPLANRATYFDRVAAIEAKYPDGDIPRPSHWTGFTLNPIAMEFWIDRPGRMHDRRRFERSSAQAAWSDTLLYP